MAGVFIAPIPVKTADILSPSFPLAYPAACFAMLALVEASPDAVMFGFSDVAGLGLVVAAFFFI